MTYPFYPVGDQGCLNDLTIGWPLVQPSDFDLPQLSGHKPALFIATPVLKKIEGLRIPFLEKLAPWLGRLKRKSRQSFFVYGGWWKAKPCAQEGLAINRVYGRSTNQELQAGSLTVGLEVDDTVFFGHHKVSR